MLGAKPYAKHDVSRTPILNPYPAPDAIDAGTSSPPRPRPNPCPARGRWDPAHTGETSTEEGVDAGSQAQARMRGESSAGMVHTILVVARRTRGIRRYGRPRAIRLSRCTNAGSPNHTQAQGRRKKRWHERLQDGTHLGALRGLRPSTMQAFPLDLHRRHVFSPGGKSHFIYTTRRAPSTHRHGSAPHVEKTIREARQKMKQPA